ncbi:MAG: acetate/propionate family kinase [Pseudomonadota bacterium]
MTALLTLNAGSSSVKFSVYLSDDDLTRLAHGQVESVGGTARLSLEHGQTTIQEQVRADSQAAALSVVLEALEPVLKGRRVAGIGHRIVHGGKGFDGPALLTSDVVKQLQSLTPLAPLHQPANLSGVAAAREAFPGAIQVGCFDTAFHRNHPWVNDTFALPRKLYDEGVRRYGFHGLSYQYVTEALRQDAPDIAKGRVVIAHLGNGASMCALRDCVSIGSTMGFSALDGLPMGTRCGQLDPGVILYLLDQGWSAEAISDLLYKESGLKGLSGISHDMRTLLDSDAAEAREAIDYFTFRLRREIGAMAAVLGGIDALVFCGGIGEHAPSIRSEAVRGLDYLGLRMDEPANQRSEPKISSGDVPILVVPTDEERVIARATQHLLQSGSGHWPSTPLPVGVRAAS